MNVAQHFSAGFLRANQSSPVGTTEIAKGVSPWEKWVIRMAALAEGGRKTTGGTPVLHSGIGGSHSVRPRPLWRHITLT